MNAVTEVMDELRKALSELEDCRARSADLRTMLEQVTRDRDHVEESLVRLETQRDEARSALAACPDCAMWAERAARWHDDMQRAERERDEAREDADRWKRSCNVFRERDWPKAFQVTVTSLEREVSDAYEQLAKLRKLSKPWEGGAYRRGAEAMRKRCEELVKHNSHEDGIGMGSQRIESAIRALPIPEEP